MMYFNKPLFFVLILFFGTKSIQAQESTTLTLQEAIQLALENGNKSKISQDKVTTAKNELKVTKNLRYPDAKISGQYQYLTNAKIDLQTSNGDNNGSNAEDNGGNSDNNIPTVNQLFLGQANITMPVFTGFKLKNAVAASDNAYKAASFTAANDREQIALETIKDYINLYKAKQSIGLIEENLKSAQQRVKDFTDMEQNGLLAKNDLLKANLQESNIEVALAEARKNESILNYQLAVTLKLPENTQINTNEREFGIVSGPQVTDSISRNDLEALRYQEQAAENRIKMARSKYYPTLSVMAGYIALDIHNALTVTNAMNFGLGLSYNFADIFKTKSEVQVAKSKAAEIQHTLDMTSDQIKVQIKNADQEYQLALKKYQVYVKSEVQASENYRIVKDKYDNGLQDTNDLLEADVEQLQAKINLAYAKADIAQKYYELITAKGNLMNTITDK
jgi:outer membrane protein TolC